MTNLYTEGSAWDVITPSWRRYLPVMPDLAGPGVTFHTTNNDSKYVDGTTQKLYLVMMQDMGVLATDFGLWVEKDINTYGAIMTTTDPAKSAGGGAILIGHGLTSANDPPHIQLTDYAINSNFGTLYIYKLDSNWNRLPGDLNVGELISTTLNQADPWQNWNIVFDIQNGSDGAIRNLTGNLLFGLNYDGNFYWASINTQTYTMVLDHW